MEENSIEKSQFLSSDEEQNLLLQIHSLYELCKKMFIRAEECLPQMKLFVAPLLEHRDAFDHIMQYYDKKYDKHYPTEKLIDELKEAHGHEVRAFYDIADYTCILIRASISQRLQGVSRRKIKKIWSTYGNNREYVLQMSEELAELRCGRTGTSEFIEKYKTVVNKFYSIYEEFMTEIDPKL